MNPLLLTAAHIQSLRDNRPARVSDGTATVLAVPFITWSASENALVLHSGGYAVALSHDPAVLAACLANERAEPGFIARALDPAESCEEAALSLSRRALRQAAREASALGRATQEADARAAEDERLKWKYVNPASFDLDDLTS